MAPSPEDDPTRGPDHAASGGAPTSVAEQRRLELKIRAQNRALREKEQQLLGTVEQLQEKEEATARLAYLAQQESEKLAAALADLEEAQRDLERKVEERTRELSGALEELRNASRLKDEFLATLSHELRTPLNSILGWAAMLKTGSLDPPRVEKAVETIHRNAQAQSQLISDMLDMSRIVAGKLRLAVAPLDPSRVIDTALDTIRPAAEAKAIRLEAILDPHAGPVLADPDRLQQVLWNLLTNAVKFTPKGGKVVVALQRVNSHVQIRVQDSGVGIPADFLPHVFDRFRQADSSSTRRYGGLGLGLAIVRHLVELHGGTVYADSEGDGQGSVFVVRLPVMSVAPLAGEAHAAPAQPASAPGEALADAPTLEGVRVLVVDDEADARELVSAVLAARGAEVETATSADEGLRVLKERRPDVLLCDIEMPGGDGYGMIAAVRRLSPGEGGRIPAGALTAYARAEDRVRCLRAGFDLHFPKPIEPAELIVAVATLATRKQSAPGAGNPPRGD